MASVYLHPISYPEMSIWVAVLQMESSVLNYRVTNTSLKGTDYDGSEYDSPVNYFIVFAYNIGFHDAPWQPWFGGNRYTYAGSHGCINLPNDSAAYMNANVPNDIAVVAYYRNPVI